jgi:hypothetical protein
VDPEAEPAERVRTSGLASAALATALASWACLWGIGGFAAVVLGISARSAIRRSNGLLTGLALAHTSIVLGALNVLAAVLAVVALLSLDLGAASPPTRGPALPAKPFVPSPRPPRAETPAARSSVEPGVITTELGRLSLVDLPAELPSVRGELARQLTEARAKDQLVVVWLVAPSCAPCNGFALALPDHRMQEALERVRLVRIDVASHGPELQRLNLYEQKIPAFLLLSEEARPVDVIHGGEWDDDVAANIAPVMRRFVRGTYIHRRDPWRGGHRADETTL